MRKFIVLLGKKFMELLTKVSPKLSGKVLFFIRMKKIPNLKSPKTFNEKTTWLKLNKYSNHNLVAKCADKYTVRKYVKDHGLGDILNDLYGVYDNFDDIDFDKLPDKFVIKCTHGRAYNIICANKNNFDKNMARKSINKWLNEKYGLATTELHYLKIKPRIIIEKYLCDKDGNMPIDYKFYCINGEVVGVLVCTDRKNGHIMKQNFYDLKWNELPYIKEQYRNNDKIEKPKKLKEMVNYAKELSKDFPFVRVDLYNDKGNIIFGELTFTPACCCNNKYNKLGDLKLGENFRINNFQMQVLLSTMNDKNPKKWIKSMNVKDDYVIVNQITDKKVNLTNEENIISIRDKGLSKSRNLAVKTACREIGLLSDYDMVYVDDYDKIITDAYEKYPDADLIAFIVEHENKKFEKTPFKEGKLGFIKTLRISSVQLTINLNSVKNKYIKFDESFGSGAKLYMGEENIFMSDCIKNGFKIYYVPQKIGTLKVLNKSTWFNGYNKKYFIVKGAVFYRMSKFLCPLLILQFAVRKNRLYKKNISMFKSIKFMFIGASKYKNEYKNF